MIINKKDLKKISDKILLKAIKILKRLDTATKNNLNIDKDVISIKVNNQYRILYRASTQIEARLLKHNDYNRVINAKYVYNIK